MQLSDFKTYVKQDFKRRDKDTEMVQAYNDMIMWLAIKMPIGDYKYQSYVPLSAGYEDYEIPSDLMHLIHPIRLLDGSNPSDSGWSLINISKEQYDIMEPNPNRNDPVGTSDPTHYTIFSRSILVTPIPNTSTKLLEISWGKRPSTQANATDTPALGTEYDQVLKAGTLERLYAGLQQYGESTFWGSKYHDQEDKPVGVLYDLFRAETAREGNTIGHVKNNSL